MDCEAIKSIIPKYVAHSTTEDETTQIEEHLCICEDCRQFLNKIIDNPKKAETTIFEPTNTSTNQKSKSTNFLDYIVLGIGVCILLFLIYIFLKG